MRWTLRGENQRDSSWIGYREGDGWMDGGRDLGCDGMGWNGMGLSSEMMWFNELVVGLRIVRVTSTVPLRLKY